MRTKSPRYTLLVTGAVLLIGLWSDVAAQDATFTEREVTFRNGTVELHGTLLLPTASGFAPAVVFLHGSGPATRSGARPYAEEFAQLGLASLLFDKRGSGSSGGSWLTASLDDLAADALAAVEYLKTVAGVDPGRIGFWGVSQAGWVAPVAASRSSDVAFMILISGGGASPRESELFSYQNEFERAGLSSAETVEATEILEQYFEYLATGEARAELVTRLEGIRGTRLNPLAEQLDQVLPSEDNRMNWSWVGDHDPVQYMESVRSPILLMFGDRDTDHPTELATTRWREGLARAGNESVTLMVFPGAGHGVRMRAGHSGPGSAPFAHGYIEVQLGWLWLHVVNGRR